MKHLYTATLATLAASFVGCGVKTGKDVVNKTADAVYHSIDEDFLDKNTRPQDDFFQFANGTWCKNNPVPDSESRWGSFNELDEANKKKLTEILQAAAHTNEAKGTQNQILGDYYKSFINMDVRNEMGMEPIEAELNMVEAIERKQDIASVVGKLHANGVRMFFSFGVGQDLKNVEKNISSFYQGGIGLPNRDYYFSEDKKEILTKYGAFVAEIFQLSGTDVDEAARNSKEIVAFETKLASSMLRPAEMRVPERTYNRTAKLDFEKTVPSFAFEKYLESTGSLSFDTLIVGMPDYAVNMNKAIEETDLKVLKNYMRWSILNHYAGHLNVRFVQANFNFYAGVLSGKKEMKSLNEQCIDEITRMNFGEWLGKAFVEKHFSQKAADRVNEMVDNLLAVYKERINNLEWMSATTKKEALNKLQSIGRKLGYPEVWEDYSSIYMDDKNYVSNYRNAIKFGHEKNMSELNDLVNKKEWGMPAHMVNAYYHPLLNEIAFPAGIMQAPFFDENAEDAVNYGRIGMVIGHEFTHGFDDMGSKFAADGTFTNWWTEEDRAAFEKRTKAFGETYAGFCPVDGHCVNPELTMGENIADLGGLTMAYYAYTRTSEFKSGVKRNGYSPAQRFFISYAQLWKINYTESELKNRIANDPHSPGMYRVNGPLMNCPEFFAAFDVKEGDKMRNTGNKMVTIW